MPARQTDTKTYLAFDLGAASSRAILGSFDGTSMQVKELHRFTTPLIEEGERLYWDLDVLWREVCQSLEHAQRTVSSLRSVSVDSWGVDYVPLDRDGRPVRKAHCYRDPRTLGMQEKLKRRIPAAEIYATTGIQPMEINTLYQVCADREQDPVLYERTVMRLMMADYFNYRLSGRAVAEVSLASTTQLMDARSRAWSSELMRALDIPPGSWPEIVPSGTRLGKADGASDVEVIAGCSHDTACAVAAVPIAQTGEMPWAYLSCGTWSLLGVERPVPHLTAAAREAGLTNEAGFGGTIRLLKNLNGLWVLQECEREWGAQGEHFTYEDLIREAEAAPSLPPIDLNDARFGLRGGMQQKIAAYCQEHGMPVPASRGELVRLILESLADSYRRTVRTLEELIGASIATLYMVGGGSQNALLCQLTADACGCRVQAGPAEATALGNLLIQARTMGDIPEGTLIRDVVRRSTELHLYTPRRITA